MARALVVRTVLMMAVLGVAAAASSSPGTRASVREILGVRHPVTMTAKVTATIHSWRASRPMLCSSLRASAGASGVPVIPGGIKRTRIRARADHVRQRQLGLLAIVKSRANPLAPFTMDRRTTEIGTRNQVSENNSFYLLTTVVALSLAVGFPLESRQRFGGQRSSAGPPA